MLVCRRIPRIRDGRRYPGQSTQFWVDKNGCGCTPSAVEVLVYEWMIALVLSVDPIKSVEVSGEEICQLEL